MASLVKQLDQLIADKKDQKLAAFVCFLAPEQVVAEEAARLFGEQHSIKNVPLVVPVEHKDGPTGFSISADADVTVMCYEASKVTANHAFATGKLDAKGIAAVLADAVKSTE